MAQTARKMVNCDLGHSLFIDKGRIRFFFVSGDKTRLFRLRSGREIRAFWPLTRKIVLPSAVKKCLRSQFAILGFASDCNLHAI